jgi:hypothetical protein
MKLTKVFLAISSALIMTVFTAFPATAEDAPEKVFSGTIEIDSTQMAFIVSGQAGGGVLEFEGEEHEFSIGGLGVGGIGVQKINAVGSVYNLDKLSDFNGVYVQGRMGVTVGKGKGGISLTNTKTGVIIDLRSSAKGAALSLGVDGMSVKLK